MPSADPRNCSDFRDKLHCDLRVRWKVASDLRFRAAISEPKTPSFCGISGDLALSSQVDTFLTPEKTLPGVGCV